jgi:N-acetyl sugar amidotransferase
MTSPSAMRWCKRCCEPDTRPTCVFDDEGVCYPCRYAEKYTHIDWAERRKVLAEIVEWAKQNNTSGYDCIIGVSGGKDSTRQALFAHEIGLNPLLVSCAYPPEQHLERGARNLANLVSLGFDTITVAPAPQTSKALMRNCFIKFGNMFNAAELALFACLPKMAIAYRIPLVLLGENPALSWGTSAGGSLDYLGNAMRHSNTLQGGDYRRFLADGMDGKDVYWYRYPTDDELDRGNLKIVYLGYFIPDFNDHSNSRVSIENGLRVREGEEANPENTGSLYNSICLDDDFVLVNQMLKYLKYGFGMASQEVSGAIRAGLMTREEGIAYIKKYDGKIADHYVRRLSDYMGMSVADFWEIAEKFRNRDIWEKTAQGEWKLKTELH